MMPDESRDEPATDTSPVHATATLYAASPHAATDLRARMRRERRRAYGDDHPLFFGRASKIQNPTKLVIAVLVAGLLWLSRSLYMPSSWLASSSGRYVGGGVPAGVATAGPALAPPSFLSPPHHPPMPAQKTFTLAARSKGCHLVQAEVEREIRDMLQGVQVGLLTLFLQHTSAALSLNENFDKTVRTDMDMALDRIVPESLPWQHTDEGPDDSVSHTKSSLIGPSVTIPITNGRLNLGTWQGVYLCEFRRQKHARRIVATVLP
ncbi:hypothetical protein ACI68E_000232 [Malassezia pachydermatis]